MAIIMVLNLYAVRLVLQNLGVQDYGIFDVVAGVVTMFQSVSGVLSIATQRFFSYALGENDKIKYQQMFSSSINVFLALSAIVLLVGESVGIWFVNNHLVIPSERLITANYLFQFTLFSFVLTMLQTPLSSVVVAHEDMGIFAVISLADGVLKFLAAFSLSYLPYDRLGTYGFLLLLVSLFSVVTYAFVVFKKYENCRYSIKDNQYCKQILSFSGWTFIGTSASVGMNQVCTIIVNVFFGPVTNAARAIGCQIGNALNAFCGNFLMAIRPPLIKSYADERYDDVNNLFYYSSKIIYFAILVIFVPLFLEMDFIISIWLKTSDQQTVLFSRLMLIYILILSLSHPITYIMHATGYVKQYHLTSEIPTLAIMPLTYIAYKIGFPAYTTYLIMIIAIIGSHIIRILCLKKYYSKFQGHRYLYDFILKSLLYTLISVPLIVYIHNMLDQGFLKLCIVTVLSIIIIMLALVIFGLTKEEKQKVYVFFSKRLKR